VRCVCPHLPAFCILHQNTHFPLLRPLFIPALLLLIPTTSFIIVIRPSALGNSLPPQPGTEDPNSCPRSAPRPQPKTGNGRREARVAHWRLAHSTGISHFPLYRIFYCSCSSSDRSCPLPAHRRRAAYMWPGGDLIGTTEARTTLQNRYQLAKHNKRYVHGTYMRQPAVGGYPRRGVRADTFKTSR
jgi:hypothetical protein